MSKPTIEEILAPKPEVRPRIYAYSIADAAHSGLLKVGQTTRNVKHRVAEPLKTARIKNYTIELDESAERDAGPEPQHQRAPRQHVRGDAEGDAGADDRLDRRIARLHRALPHQEGAADLVDTVEVHARLRQHPNGERGEDDGYPHQNHPRKALIRHRYSPLRAAHFARVMAASSPDRSLAEPRKVGCASRAPPASRTFN